MQRGAFAMDIDDHNVRDFIDGIQIPPIPDLLVKLHQELQKPAPDVKRVATIVAQDVGISALVLRTVNSAFFGLRAKVNSIQHATSLLGLKNTANIVTGLLLRQAMEASGANPTHFWDSPVNTALGAAFLAKRLGGVAPDEAYLLGLFHNVGHALLIDAFHDYQTFMDTAINDPGATVTDLEDRRYSTNHATLGYYLARSWGVQRETARLIRDHHDIDTVLSSERTAQGKLMCLLKVAEHADKRFWGINPDFEWQRVADRVERYLELTDHEMLDLLEDLAQQFIDAPTV
jgi:HD-like signal output (HDOD) protein